MKKNIFEGLEPVGVWSIFEDILKIPRPSKHEEQIREYLRIFAAKEKLKIREDAKGNVVIYKQASAGFAARETVVLQSHMDMVCEKDASLEHDFMRDAIEAYVEDGWVKARGTTLGADCGIGMALQLAVLRDKSLRHGAIEALFTVDEEQGLSGAMELGDDLLAGKYLINLDSEDEGEIFIGCAGGVDTVGVYDAKAENMVSENMAIYNIGVSGLLGGHSGDDIEKGRACANKIMGWMLYEAFKLDKAALLVKIDGGNLRNAIARDATATVAVSADRADAVWRRMEDIKASFVMQFKPVEKELKIDVLKVKCDGCKALNRGAAENVANALVMIPHGVIEMSRSIDGLVETSTNLASVKQREGKIFITTSQRSSVHEAKMMIASTVENIMRVGAKEILVGDGYPGWTPNLESKLLNICEETYKKIFSKLPKIKAIHAGLECGLILEKYPKMEAVSIGPTLRNVHSPSEKLDVYTVKQAWEFLLGVLESI